MYNIEFESTFKKDFKKLKKKKWKMSLLESALKILGCDGSLPPSYRPHKLKGNFNSYWECHIQPDWLLIWKKDTKNKTIYLVRTGTHDAIFK